MTISPAVLAVLQQEMEATDAERNLARRLNVELLGAADLHSDSNCHYVLEFTSSGLALRGTEKNNKGRLRVDFTSKEIQRRVQQSVKAQNLGKAVGLSKHTGLHVLDATAGLGADGFLLASAGCTVTMLERSGLVFELLQDGIARGQQAGASTQQALSRINIAHQEFLDYPPKTGFDVVYLDPMFPAKRSSARAKKAMFFLQQLLSDPSNEAQLLTHARKLASRRVVVKRARLAPLAGGQQPDIQFKGSSSRFDVYLNH